MPENIKRYKRLRGTTNPSDLRSLQWRLLINMATCLFALGTPIVSSEPLPVGGGSLAGGSSPVQCEPMNVALCEKLAYRWTRMPNFFGDTSQLEAGERSQAFVGLVASRCSKHLQAYLCELLAPVCLEHSHEAMRRFEIYPCRSMCRRVKRDCEAQLSQVSRMSLGPTVEMALKAALACDQLPFEANGGNGTLNGPCHEPPDEPISSQQATGSTSTGYLPYQPALDTNSPPFITDVSPLDVTGRLKLQPLDMDSSIHRQTRPGDLVPPKDIQPTTHNFSSSELRPLEQVKWAGQQVLATLIKNSNLLSIFSILLLLLALNAKRLSRLKARLTGSASSTTTSGCHFASKLGCHVDQQPRHLSPSASSRSLMLITNGCKQPPTHRLLGPSTDDYLMHHKQQQQLQLQLDSRGQRTGSGGHYLLVEAQSANKRQTSPGSLVAGRLTDERHLFSTMRSESSSNGPSNQYDYIQVGGAGRPESEFDLEQQLKCQQEPQLYSNILLSSPSHQVLLGGGSHTHAAVPFGSELGRPPPLPSTAPTGSSMSAAEYLRSFQRSRGQRHGSKAVGPSHQRQPSERSHLRQPLIVPRTSGSSSSSSSADGLSPPTNCSSSSQGALLAACTGSPAARHHARRPRDL